MARYKRINTGMKSLPIDLSRQLISGTFEHALSHLIDHELDLRDLDKRFENDATGAPAYAPSVLLKVILYAYSRGMITSRAIAQACQDNTRSLVAAQANLHSRLSELCERPQPQCGVHDFVRGQPSALHDDRLLCARAQR